MKKTNFNFNWKYLIGEQSMMANIMGFKPEVHEVDLPHDAMIMEERNPDTGNKGHTGYYPGGIYTYVKTVEIPETWQKKDIYLEFEGVFANAMVYVNDDLVVNRPYGYSEFHAILNDYLLYGKTNEIKVICNTAMEHQSRWYTGSGIYRPVNLYVADTLHVALNGLSIVAKDIEPDSAVVEINAVIENNGNKVREASVTGEIANRLGEIKNKVESPLTIRSNSSTKLRFRLTVDNPDLWSCETPDLYKLYMKIVESGETVDETETTFGIRKLQLDPVHGLRLNGIGTKLRGACIHHDNGVIGAAAFPRADFRRVEQLKEAGFNCIRSSHNPAGRSLLDACDKLGMLVIDETFDIWMKSKNSNDYANHFLEWWERDLESMVKKDINHPSVIIYSLGNELPDIANRFGKDWNRKLAEKIRSIDDTRFVTNSLNLMFLNEFKQVAYSVMNELGIGVDSASTGNSDNSGVNALNKFLALLSGPLSDKIMAHEIIDAKSNEFFSVLDIAGINYAPGKYEADLKRHPERVILGTEDFPGDIVRLWGEVKKFPHVIGDMTWTGYDYLGEAGAGTFNYEGGTTFGAPYPARSAGMGDIDLIGNRLPVSYLRQIVFGLRKAPYIGVERVNRFGEKAFKSPWKLYDDISGWTWPGYEDRPARIFVYSASEEVELFLNDKSLGKKPSGEKNGFITEFETVYKPGELVALGYTDGVEDGRMSLVTASENLQLNVSADRPEIIADGSDLAYVMIKLCDERNILNHTAKKTVHVSVDGPGSLQGLGNADPMSVGNFFDSRFETYDGMVLAVIRSGKNPGHITVTVSADGCEDVKLGIDSI